MAYNPGLTIRNSTRAMQETLCSWVNQNTHYANLHGQDRFANMLCQVLEDLADCVHRVELPPISIIDSHGHWQEQAMGSAVVAVKRPHASMQWYLGGHYDTVFSGNSGFQQAAWQSTDVLGGPGVLDMKGGLIIMLEALRAFEASPFASQVGWRIVLNPDEEIGSPASASLIEQQAKGCQLGFIFEPAMDAKGTWAGARGGSAKYTLVVRGKTAHVGRNFHEGRNAIVQCAQWITRLAAINHDFPQCAVNIGKIHGGEALNQVPNLAMAYLDVRAPTQADLMAIEQAIATVLVNHDSDYQLEWHRTMGRTPKPLTEPQLQLLTWSQAYLASHHAHVDWRDTGGCCDGNNLSALNIPNLDTLGGCGGQIHTEHEWLAVPSLVERAEQAAWLWHGLAEARLFEPH